MIFIDIDENWYKYNLIYQLHRRTSTDITPTRVLETFHMHLEADDMDSKKIENLERGAWVQILVLVRKNLTLLVQTRYV